MEAYAVIETGGKQYRVTAGATLHVERLADEAGASVQFDRVLALSDGSQLTVGTPAIDGAAVSAEVVEHLRGPKVFSFKKKRRKGYKRKVGHRQELTRIRITSLTATRADTSAAPAAEETAEV